MPTIAIAADLIAKDQHAGPLTEADLDAAIAYNSASPTLWPCEFESCAGIHCSADRRECDPPMAAEACTDIGADPPRGTPTALDFALTVLIWLIGWIAFACGAYLLWRWLT